MKTYATEHRLADIARTIAAPGVPVAIDSTFESLAFDSLDCIEFVTAVEDAFGVEISCVERVNFENLFDVARHIEGVRVAPMALAA